MVEVRMRPKTTVKNSNSFKIQAFADLRHHHPTSFLIKMLLKDNIQRLLNNNVLNIISLVLKIPDKGLFNKNVRLEMHKYCFSNVGAINTKGLILPPRN